MHFTVGIITVDVFIKMINKLNISGGRRMNIISTDAHAADSQ